MRIIQRARRWFMWHSIRQHLLAPIWVRIPEKHRWGIVYKLNESPRHCWCDLVDAALSYREDDPCDIHLPLADRDSAIRCASECNWSHPDCTGRHECGCYCGKFQFMAPNGAMDREEKLAGFPTKLA